MEWIYHPAQPCPVPPPTLPLRRPRCVRKELKEISPTEDIGLARTTMNLMLSMMDDFVPVGEGEDAMPAPGEGRVKARSWWTRGYY